MKTRMSKYFSLVLCGLLLSSGCGGGVAGPTPAPLATLSTNTLTFSSQFEGTTSPAQSLMLSNTGNGNLSVASIAATGDFAETNTCTAPLAPGANCVISVTFGPGTSTGSLTGTLSVNDNAPGSPQTVALSGTGTSGTMNGDCFELVYGTNGCSLVQHSAIAGECLAGQPPEKLASTVCESEHGASWTIYYEAGSNCGWAGTNNFKHGGSCWVNP